MKIEAILAIASNSYSPFARDEYLFGGEATQDRLVSPSVFAPEITAGTPADVKAYSILVVWILRFGGEGYHDSDGFVPVLPGHYRDGAPKGSRPKRGLITGLARDSQPAIGGRAKLMQRRSLPLAGRVGVVSWEVARCGVD